METTTIIYIIIAIAIVVISIKDPLWLFFEKMRIERRIQLAVLLVLYEKSPDGMTPEEIEIAIEEKGLLWMTDKEFDKCRKEIIANKKY